MLEIRAKMDDDVYLIVIRVNGQCWCKHLKASGLSPSLTMHDVFKSVVPNCQAKLNRIWPGRIRLELLFRDLHVRCLHVNKDCTLVTTNNGKVVVAQFELDDGLLLALHPNVSIIKFSYSTNKRNALDIKHFLDLIMSPSKRSLMDPIVTI